VVLQELEVLEIKRLTVLKEQNQRFSQSHDFLKSAIEQMAVLLKEGVSAAKLEQDIQDFIKSSVTGKSPPPHVAYQPQPSEIIGHMAEVKSPPPPSSSSMHLTQTISKPPPPTTINTNTNTFNPMNPASNNTPKASPIKTTTEIKKPPPPPAAHNEPQEWYARALYDFESDEPDDLPFVVDAVIKILQMSDTDDWWQGELNGRRGMFPKNYVEKSLGPPKKGSIATAPVQPPVQPQPQQQPVAINNNNQASAADGAPRVMNAKCEALFDFDGQDNDDLPFKKGDMLIITGELDGWFLGKTIDGARTGIFPSNYVKLK